MFTSTENISYGSASPSSKSTQKTEPITYTWKNISVWVGSENNGNGGDGGADTEDPDGNSGSSFGFGCCRKNSRNGQVSKQILNNGTSLNKLDLRSSSRHIIKP